MRRNAFSGLVLLPLLAGLQVFAAAPNIVFILTDDLGYGDVGLFFQNLRRTNNIASEPWHMTPKLDALGNEGLQLRRYYCSAPVCAPSRASLLLGVHQGHANVRDNQFDKALENNHTLGTVLKQAGYATAAIGKYGLQGGGGNPAAWPAYPTKRGFDYYFGYVRHGDGHEHYPKEGLYEGVKECYDGTNNITPQLDKCYTADLFTARAKRWIMDQRATNSLNPFFLYLAYDTPHAVIELPTQAYPAGGGTNGGLTWNGTAGNMINTASGTIDSYYHPDYASGTWDDDQNASTPVVAWPDVYKRYATAVRRIDDCVGDIIKLLKDLNIDTNTLVIFTSDNGPSKESYLPQAYEPNFFNSFGPCDGIKRDTWEGGIRVGALARWPGVIATNRTSDLACSASDWMATFAEMAGLPTPARSDGVSLLPTFKNIGTQKSPLVYIEYYEGGNTPNYTEFAPAHRNRVRDQMQALFEGNYKGVRYNIQSATNDFEIYDMAADSHETNNLALSPSFAGLQKFLKERVLQVRRPNSSAGRPYDSAYVPASTNTLYTNGVLQYAAYEGTWPWVPEFSSLTSVSTGKVVGLDLSVRTRDDNFGIAYSGYLTIPADGDYVFYLTSDSGTSFRIHDATVIDDDFERTGAEVSGSVRLAAGRHPFRLYYRHGAGARVLDLKYSGSGIAKQSIPLSTFSLTGIGDPRPFVLDDRVQTLQGVPVMVPVLANDTDDGQPAPLSIVSITQPAKGTAAIVSNQVRYSPATNFLGEDNFTYTLSDGLYSATGKVTVAVYIADNTLWLPFNEITGLETVDSTGRFTGSLIGFTDEDSAWVAGRWGRALAFTGVEYVQVGGGYLPPSGTSARTTAAWIKTAAPGAIIAWGPNSTSRKWHMRLESAAAGIGTLRVEIGGGFVRGTRDLRDNQWHHVAGVLPQSASPNATNLLLYVDGVPETLASISASPITTDSVGATIGVDSQSRYFTGIIDEVRIYNRALSASEVAALYNATNQCAAAWNRRYFGDSAPNWYSDEDADGGARLLEYALGTQPLAPDAAHMCVAAEAANNHLHVRFPRRLAGTHELNYTLQSSTNLVNWSNLAVTPLASEPSDLSGFETAVYETAARLSSNDRFYVRLAVAWQ